jgi:GNAT superfamily N-acetyltransferase
MEIESGEPKRPCSRTRPMSDENVMIEVCELPPVDSEGDALIDGLAELLVDAVDSGASVSFAGALDRGVAQEWWRRTLATFGDRDVLLVARDSEGIQGTVHVRGCWQSNQRFRGEVMKLLVHRRARRRGLGNALMDAIEEQARLKGLTLLVLDTNAQSEADRLYIRRGWVRLGEIPGYSLRYDGQPWPAAFFYKHLT